MTMNATHTTETFDTFPARAGHVRAALYNLRHRRAERMPLHIARRAESLLCDLGERLENGELCTLGQLESLSLYRRAQALQAIHGRRDNDNMYPISL